MKQKARALKIILSKDLLFAGSNMHATTLYNLITVDVYDQAK